MRYIDFQFKDIQKNSKSGKMKIHGLSNANTVDRIQERIDPKGWRLDNYKKNPVVLFDHGHDPSFGSTPIGKAIVVEPQDKGLYTEIEISGSKTEKISAVRDLIEEGILKTFSVGFNPIENEKSADEPDVNIIKIADLIEQSVVPIPMNQDSTFALAGKSFKLHSKLAKKWWGQHVDRIMLAKKGAWVAAALHQRMYDMVDHGDIADVESALKEVAKSAGVNVKDITDVLSGQITPVPEPIVEAFAKMLRLDKDFLVNLNKGDVALIERVADRRNQPPTDEGGKGMPTDDKNKKEKGVAKPVIHQVTIPKSVADTPEAAAEMAAAAGYSTEKMSENDEGYVFEQSPGEGLDLEKATKMDLGDGVMAVICPTKPKDSGQGAESGESNDDKKSADGKQGDETDGKEGDGAAKTEGDGKEENADQNEADEPKSVSELLSSALAMVQGKEGMDDLVKLLEQAATQAKDGAKGGSVIAIIKRVNDELAALGIKNIEGTDDNPYLALAGQTNVLLGTLIKEIQGMSGKLDGLADLTLAKAKEEGEAEEMDDADSEAGKDDETAKGFDTLRTYRRDLDTKLKRLGV
jgi:HK97 family phage prohead protease